MSHQDPNRPTDRPRPPSRPPRRPSTGSSPPADLAGVRFRRRLHLDARRRWPARPSSGPGPTRRPSSTASPPPARSPCRPGPRRGRPRRPIRRSSSCCGPGPRPRRGPGRRPAPPHARGPRRAVHGRRLRRLRRRRQPAGVAADRRPTRPRFTATPGRAAAARGAAPPGRAVARPPAARRPTRPADVADRHGPPRDRPALGLAASGRPAAANGPTCGRCSAGLPAGALVVGRRRLRRLRDLGSDARLAAGTSWCASGPTSGCSGAWATPANGTGWSTSGRTGRRPGRDPPLVLRLVVVHGRPAPGLPGHLGARRGAP